MYFQDAGTQAQTPTTPINSVAHQATTMWHDVQVWATTKGPGILFALVLLVAALVLAGWVRKMVIAALLKARLELTLAKFFGNLAKWGIIFFALIACMGTFGVNTTSFAALVGGAGLAVGLALQGNLGNLASGILILIFRPFKIGDSVVIAGQPGIVDGIDLFTTNLDTLDNRRVIVPNGAIINGVIENQTRHPQRGVVVSIPVHAGADVDQTRDELAGAAERVVESIPGALKTPAPSVALTDLAPSLTWTVTVWAQTSHFGAVRQALLREIKFGLDSAGIAIGPGAALPPHIPVVPREAPVRSMPERGASRA